MTWHGVACGFACAVRIRRNNIGANVLKVAYYSFDGVRMEYKRTSFNSFENGSKLFFSSLFTVCLSLLPFYVKFEQLNVNK